MPVVCEWPDVDVLEYDAVKAGDALLAARSNLLAAHSANVARSRRSLSGYDTYGNLRGVEVEALLRELRRLYASSSGVRESDVGRAVSKLVVYKSLPVRVYDGVEWVDDVVESVSGHHDGCLNKSPHFMVREHAGHWHLSDYRGSWEVRRGVEGSLEQVLTGLLSEEALSESEVSRIVESVVEACVIRIDCGVVFDREEVSSVERT